MKLRIPLILMGCLIGAASQAKAIADIHGRQGPLYDDAVLRGFQVMDVSLGMTLSEAAAALSKQGFKPVEKVVELSTKGSKEGGVDVTFRGLQGEITLTYIKLTDRPGRVSGVFFWKGQSEPADGKGLTERANKFVTRYGFPSMWEVESNIENFSGASFSWVSQESFRQGNVLKNARACRADWQRAEASKRLNCAEILRNANSAELTVVISGDATMYMLNDFPAAYESLRTNAEFMKQQSNVGSVFGV